MSGFIKSKPSEAQREREAQKARRILNVSRHAEDAEIRDQFKLLLHANHPDGQQRSDYGGVLTIEDLRWAKDVLIKESKNV